LRRDGGKEVLDEDQKKDPQVSILLHDFLYKLFQNDSYLLQMLSFLFISVWLFLSISVWLFLLVISVYFSLVISAGHFCWSFLLAKTVDSSWLAQVVQPNQFISYVPGYRF